jgi:hypothetical protein
VKFQNGANVRIVAGDRMTASGATRTFGNIPTSAKCQKRTHAPQQLAKAVITCLFNRGASTTSGIVLLIDKLIDNDPNEALACPAE